MSNLLSESLKQEETVDNPALKSLDHTHDKSQQARVEAMIKNEILAAQQVLQSINSDLDSSKSSVSNSKHADADVHWEKFDYDWRKDEKLTSNVKSCDGENAS